MKSSGSAYRRTILCAAVLLTVVFLLMPSSVSAGLTEFFSATGKLFLSVDAAGSNAASHIAEVEKPNTGATVRKAFVLAASTGFSGRVLANGDVTMNGIGINWDMAVPSSIRSNNHLADVTAIVKPAIDAAPPGRIPFTFTEVNTDGIDGEILVVIFDDPRQTSEQTIILLFGAQNIAGDTFAITLATPIDPEFPGVVADMGLGISYGFQGPNQFSVVKVNNARVTTSAGGQDDGQGSNGALITSGGLDDSNANPADPSATPSGDPRIDDELYSLLPFIRATDTSISVFTRNPSNDDNVFFAYFRLSAATVIGEGIVLSPASAANKIGTTHTVTAKVVNDNGDPVPNRLVTFKVMSGPNLGETDTSTTDTNGEAAFTYTGNGGVGTDEIQASFFSSATEETVVSNIVTKRWITSMGDINGNGVLDPDDARLLLEVLVGSSSPEAVNFLDVGDMNADGVIDNLDSALIRGVVDGRIPPPPDHTRITVTHSGAVAGSAGAVPGGSMVNLSNATSHTTVSVSSASDGSFSAVIAAVLGDTIIIDVDGGPAKISVMVGGVVNKPPIPAALPIITAQDMPDTSQVDPNDPDIDQTHTFIVITPPLNGIAAVDANGLVTYTPNTGFTGNDSLVVIVTDDGIPPLSGIVTIDVTVLNE